MIALAIDLGAGSGRAVAGHFDGRRLTVHGIHRFPNDPVRVAGRLHWDILRLYHELQHAIARAQKTDLGGVTSLGIDAWGVDFGLIDHRGELIGNPYHYRDEGTRGAMAEVLSIVPREEIFARTGVQFMSLDSLYRLYAIARDNPSLLERAAVLLMIPDLLRYFLTGERSSEYTNASTTQFLNLGVGELGLLPFRAPPTPPRRSSSTSFPRPRPQGRCCPASPRSSPSPRCLSSRWPATTLRQPSLPFQGRATSRTSVRGPGLCLERSFRTRLSMPRPLPGTSPTKAE